MAKVFISWSGDISLQVAKALHEWLPFVLQVVRPWMSTDIAAGARWNAVLGEELSTSNLGILCITRTNMTAPWLLFEAGVLVKQLTESRRVIPYCFDLKADEIAPPLSQFQGVGADYDGTLRLLQTINSICNTPLKEGQLNIAFEIFWPRLHERLCNIVINDTKAKEIDRLHQCEKELRTYPLGPATDDSLIPHYFIQEVADEFHERNIILDLVNAANRLRQAVDPRDSSVTVIRHGLLVTNDTAYAAWRSVFHEARLNSPRMLAAILMVLPIGASPLKQERDLLLAKLKTISSSTQAIIN